MISRLCDRSNSVVCAARVDVFPDVDGDGEIDIRELSTAIRVYKRKKRAGQLQTWHGNLQAQIDPVFPNWLVRRTDFRDVFSRCASKLGQIDLRLLYKEACVRLRCPCCELRTEIPAPKHVLFASISVLACAWMRQFSSPLSSVRVICI